MSLLSTGLSGLMAAQRGLEATSNNVANASTPGYVRRTILQTEATSTGGGLTAELGSGVQVVGVRRQYDQFLTNALRVATSTEQRSQVLADLGARLDTLLGNPALGISNSIQAFFDKAEVLSRDPTSASGRQQLLLEGDSLTQRFQQLNSQLSALGDEVDSRLESSATRVNAIAAAIAKVNESMGRGTAGSNDLEDQRDALLAELTTQINATVVKQEDGTVTVLVGSGQPLVLGIRSAEIGVTPDQFDPTRMQVSIDLGGGPVPISRQIAGGALGGLLAFRDDTLDPARRELGLIAAGVASAFNAQHALGVDAYGDLGDDFFQLGQPLVAAASTNSGTATVTATLADVGGLQSRDYELRFNGTAWSAIDAATGQAVALTGAGTVGSPFVFDGLSVTVGSGAAANDRFLIRPTFNAAAGVDVAITDAGSIAAAAPIRTARVLGNQSEATVAFAGITNVGNVDLRDPVQIRFDSATTFRIYSGSTDLSGPLTYSSGGDIDFNGWSVRVSGSPVAGDAFNVTPTPAGSGDNGNALALAQLGSRAVLGGGQYSIDALSARLVSSVGASALRYTQDLDIQTSLREQTEIDLQSVAGVNLDEEAANLLKYQQAYQAASKIIGVSDELFQILLGALR